MRCRADTSRSPSGESCVGGGWAGGGGGVKLAKAQPSEALPLGPRARGSWPPRSVPARTLHAQLPGLQDTQADQFKGKKRRNGQAFPGGGFPSSVPGEPGPFRLCPRSRRGASDTFQRAQKTGHVTKVAPGKLDKLVTLQDHGRPSKEHAKRE